MDRVTAIIPAAGKGRRMKAEINKQYIMLKGKPVLAHTLEVFDKHPQIDSIIVVTGKDEIEFCQEKIIAKYNFRKKIKIVAGGIERQDSVYNGLKEVKKSGLVIIHDGARPFLTPEMIDKVIESANKWGGSSTGMPVKDTIKFVDKDNFARETPDRASLWLIQTPQCFRYELLLKAHERAKIEGFYGTDDSMLLERMGQEVKLVYGDYENIKVTSPEDLIIGEALLERRS